jgi:hypothetical protein
MPELCRNADQDQGRRKQEIALSEIARKVKEIEFPGGEFSI